VSLPAHVPGWLASGKRYMYRICCSITPDPMNRQFQWWVGRRWCASNNRLPAAGESFRLDMVAMRSAAGLLVGTHDFRAFRDTNSSSRREGTTVRTVTKIEITEERGPDELLLNVEGENFLFRMVRIIAAALVDVGAGRMSADTISRALDTGDRDLMPKAAPPGGLTLDKVFYNDRPTSD